MLQLAIRGLSTTDIAAQLGWSYSKVMRLLSEGYPRLGVRSLYAAVAIAAWGEGLQGPAPVAAAKTSWTARLDLLNEQELTTIGQLARGLSQLAIAAELSLSIRRFRCLIQRMKCKLGTNFVSQWVAAAITTGRLPVPNDQLPEVFHLLIARLQPAGEQVIETIRGGASTYEEISRAIGISPTTLSRRLVRVYRSLGIDGALTSDGPAHLIALVHWADSLPD
jgi:DNA-binding CsgD family transcriptional regulator